MKISLLSHSPLINTVKAIRKCWASEDKSDSDGNTCPHCGSDNVGSIDYEADIVCWDCDFTWDSFSGDYIGVKDQELVDRVGNKYKHSSTLEHLTYTFDVDGISRACLQELARHRIASLSVKSTRYTLKELKNYDGHLGNFLVPTGNPEIDESNREQLRRVQEVLRKGASNDVVKYMLPEAYKTSLVWTINARSLQNFLKLRTSRAAIWEIRELANKIFDALPYSHKYLYEGCLNDSAH